MIAHAVLNGCAVAATYFHPTFSNLVHSASHSAILLTFSIPHRIFSIHTFAHIVANPPAVLLASHANLAASHALAASSASPAALSPSSPRLAALPATHSHHDTSIAASDANPTGSSVIVFPSASRDPYLSASA